MVKDLIVFDMDGVLVDVTASYRATIQATVKHFTGNEPHAETIQDWKNRGGWNDDWKLSHALIAERGHDTPYQTVVDQFQDIFHGDGTNGLILREHWIANDGLFERLGTNHRLAVFTGRLRWEAEVTLNRFLPEVLSPVVGIDDVTNGKPDPEGLLKICADIPHGRAWYIGDTVDDARASSAAKVPFIGIASASSPRRDALVRLLREEGAVAVIPKTSTHWRPPLPRTAKIQRDTKETQIAGSLRIEGKGKYDIATGIRFFDHMLELFTKHGGFDLTLHAKGDLDVDQHHTVEDVGIVIGQLFAKALGDRKGINRAGYFVMPMDETLAVVAGRSGRTPRVGLQRPR